MNPALVVALLASNLGLGCAGAVPKPRSGAGPASKSTTQSHDASAAVRVEPWVGVITRPVVDLVASTTSPVLEVHAHVGDAIHKGQLLITLDSRAAAAELEVRLGAAKVAASAVRKAELELRLATEREGRAIRVRQYINGDEASATAVAARIAATGLSAARAHEEEARGQLQLARIAAAQTAVVSPLDGTLSGCFAVAGSSTVVGRPLVRLVGSEPPRLRFAIPSYAIDRVELGTRLQVELPGTHQALAATVDALAPTIEPLSGMRFAEARLSERDELPAGLSARVTLSGEPR